MSDTGIITHVQFMAVAQSVEKLLNHMAKVENQQKGIRQETEILAASFKTMKHRIEECQKSMERVNEEHTQITQKVKNLELQAKHWNPQLCVNANTPGEMVSATESQIKDHRFIKNDTVYLHLEVDMRELEQQEQNTSDEKHGIDKEHTGFVNDNDC